MLLQEYQLPWHSFQDNPLLASFGHNKLDHNSCTHLPGLLATTTWQRRVQEKIQLHLVQLGELSLLWIAMPAFHSSLMGRLQVPGRKPRQKQCRTSMPEIFQQRA